MLNFIAIIAYLYLIDGGSSTLQDGIVNHLANNQVQINLQYSQDVVYSELENNFINYGGYSFSLNFNEAAGLQYSQNILCTLDTYPSYMVIMNSASPYCLSDPKQCLNMSAIPSDLINQINSNCSAYNACQDPIIASGYNSKTQSTFCSTYLLCNETPTKCNRYLGVKQVISLSINSNSNNLLTDSQVLYVDTARQFDWDGRQGQPGRGSKCRIGLFPMYLFPGQNIFQRWLSRSSYPVLELDLNGQSAPSIVTMGYNSSSIDTEDPIVWGYRSISIDECLSEFRIQVTSFEVCGNNLARKYGQLMLRFNLNRICTEFPQSLLTQFKLYFALDCTGNNGFCRIISPTGSNSDLPALLKQTFVTILLSPETKDSKNNLYIPMSALTFKDSGQYYLCISKQIEISVNPTPKATEIILGSAAIEALKVYIDYDNYRIGFKNKLLLQSDFASIGVQRMCNTTLSPEQLSGQTTQQRSQSESCTRVNDNLRVSKSGVVCEVKPAVWSLLMFGMVGLAISELSSMILFRQMRQRLKQL